MILDDEAAVAVTPVGVPAATPVIVMDNCLVALPMELVAFTVKVDVPAVVGVPEISPVDARDKPAGNEPLSRLHVMVPVPVARSFAVYAVPTVPPINDALVVITGEPGAGPAGSIFMDNSFVSSPLSFSAFTVKVYVPAVVGIPAIMPVSLERVKPNGIEPLSRLHVMGLSPFAASVWLYADPTVPPGNDPVVISGEPSSNSQSHPAIENPITATTAIITSVLIFFILNPPLVTKQTIHHLFSY
jgi:hypothetical protein